MKDLISIIIPTFNRAHLIGETLQSISQQTYQNWECIVVDDGSTDDTVEIMQELIQRDSRFQYHLRPKSLIGGANSCRNYGFEISKGKYIQWFDSDDLLKPEAFHTSISAFEAMTDAVVSKVMFTNMQTGEVYQQNNIFSPQLIADYLTGNISFYVCGPTWKRSFLEDKLLFDTSISNLDDWDFNLRMLYDKPEIIFLESPLYYYRIHTDSLSSEIRKLKPAEIKSEFKTRNKHLALLKKNNKQDYKAFLTYAQERNKYVLREALLQKQPIKYWLLQNNIIFFLSGYKFFSALKITVVFFIFIIFKKGYNLLS